MAPTKVSALAIACAIFILVSQICLASSPSDTEAYFPQALQVADPELQEIISPVDVLSRNGDGNAAFALLSRALAIATQRSLISDKAILEDKIGDYFISEAQLEQGKAALLQAEEDALSLQNQVLQAYIMVDLSLVARTYEAPAESLTLANRAMDLARKSKNLWIQSLSLGELGLSQLQNEKPDDAKSSLQEAIQIDHLNHYPQEAGHLLGLAWATFGATHNFDNAIQLAESSRKLAVSQNNYLIFIEATTSIARAYAQKGDLKHGLLLLESAKSGLDETGAKVFSDAASYKSAVSRPLTSAALLEALALTYQAAKQPSKALDNWRSVYEIVSASAFRAEAARGVATSYEALDDYESAAKWFGLEAEAWKNAGNAAKAMDAIAGAAYSLGRAGKYDDSVSALNQEESLARSQHDTHRQFISFLATAEAYKSAGKNMECYEALGHAESLLSQDLTLTDVSPALITELYAMLAEYYANLHDELNQTIALEKESTAAIRYGNRSQLVGLSREIESHLTALNVTQRAIDSHRGLDYAKALLYLELRQHYEMFNAKAENLDYNTHFNDPIVNQLINLVGEITDRPDAVTILEKNQSSLGPVASATAFITQVFLTSYYAQHNELAKTVAAAQSVWPYLHLKAADKPQRYDVQVACELTLALLTQKSTSDSVQKAKGCLEAAKGFADPDLLLSAHLIYLEAVRAGGNREDTAESDLYLRQHPIKNPQLLLSLANAQASQGQWSELIETLTRSVPLLEQVKDFHSLSLVNTRIAAAIELAEMQDKHEERGHLLKAIEFAKQARDPQQEIEATLSLARFYSREKNWNEAQEEVKLALKLSKEAHLSDIEAESLSTGGQILRESKKPLEARQAFHEAAAIYELNKNAAKECGEVLNEASVLNGELNSSKEAHDLATRALSLAIKSGQPDQVFWSDTLLSVIEAHRGNYQSAIEALRDARVRALDANAPLLAAQASLHLAGILTDVGEWQEALTLTTETIPIFKQFADKNSLRTALITLMNIYGERESDLKDFDKALEYYRQAEGLSDPANGSDGASLSLALFEIHFQQGRYKEAIADCEGPLSYFKQEDDALGEAHALLSFAEASRSAGDLKGAAEALTRAKPLVTKVADFYLTGRFYYGQANESKREGRLTDAVAQYEQVLDYLEKAKSISSIHSRESIASTYDYIYGELIDTYYALPDGGDGAQVNAGKAFNAAELNKAQNFTHTWGSSFVDGLRQKLPAPQIQKEKELGERAQSLERELNHSADTSTFKSSENERALKQVRFEQDALIAELRKSNSAYTEILYPAPHSIIDLPLRPGEVLIEIKMFEPAVFVWQIEGGPSGSKLISFYRVEKNRRWFDERITALRSAMNRGTPGAFDPTLSEDLFNALFPAGHAGVLEDAKSIIFVPDDLLFLLPMELLSPRATTGDYVLLDKPTSYFASAAAFRLGRSIGHVQRQWPISMLGIADPVTSKEDPRFEISDLVASIRPKNDGVKIASKDSRSVERTRDIALNTRGYYFDRLPETSIEVENIAALFTARNMGTVVRVGMDATKAELLKTDLGQYRFLHFATHGFLPVEPGVVEPALVLSYDGETESNMMLSPSEILSLNLHTDMVVLSACNTGSGVVHRAEGVASLGTAFLAAGSSSVTVSLWKVSDPRLSP